MFIPVSIDHIEERKSLVRDICKLISYLFIIFIFFLIVIIFYINYEHWNLTDTIYFVICTISTVGYGEPVPSNDGSRLFTIFFIIFGIFVIFAGIKDFIHNNLPVLRDFLFCKSFSQQVTEDLEIGDFYHYRKRLVLYTVLLSLWIIIGSIAVKENEEWTWIEALYFMIETSSTVGYGDMKVKRGSTKVFLCVYIIVSTLLVTLIIRTFQASMDEQDQLVLYEKRLKKMRRLNTLYSDSSDPMKDIESLYIPTRNYADQPITTHQLLLDLLIQSGKLDPATDINPWLQKINRISNEQNEITVKEELDAFLLEESNIAKEKLNRLLNQRKFSLESWQRSFFPWLFKPLSQDEENSTHPHMIGVGIRRPLNLKFPKDRILGEESVLADDEEHALGKDSQLTQRIEMVRSPLRAIKSEVSMRNPSNKAGKSNLIATKGASPYVRVPEDYASSDASAVDQSDREL